MHCLFCKLCKVPMCILYKSCETTLIEVYIFDFSKLREILIQKTHNISDWHCIVRCHNAFYSSILRVELDAWNKQCSTFFVERANPLQILFMSCMPCSTEYISEIIFTRLINVFCLRDSVIILAIHTFCACTSCIINTKISWTLFLKVICFCESSINFRFNFSERRSSLNFDVSISQVFIVPNVIVIVSFFVSCISLTLCHLFSSRPLHPFVYLQISKLPESLKLFLSFLLRAIIWLIFGFNITLYCFNACNLIKLLSFIIFWIEFFECIPLLLIKLRHFSLVLFDALLNFSFFFLFILR